MQQMVGDAEAAGQHIGHTQTGQETVRPSPTQILRGQNGDNYEEIHRAAEHNCQSVEQRNGDDFKRSHTN